LYSYKFRLYPTKQQEQQLEWTRCSCIFVYNKLLEKLNSLDKEVSKKFGIVQHHIVELKEQYPELKNIHSNTLQYENYKLFKSLKGLHNSKKNGNNVGHLHFCSRYKRMTYHYYNSVKLKETNNRCKLLRLPKIGDIKVRCHRKVEGNISLVTVRKEINQWYVIIQTDKEYTKECNGNDITAYDTNIGHLDDSDGNRIDVPLYYNKMLSKIKKRQQSLSRKKKGSNNRKKEKVKLNKLYRKINNQKIDFCNKLCYTLVNKNKIIFREDLNVSEMLSKKDKYENKRNMSDAMWGLFWTTHEKYADATNGKSKNIKVNPAYTTQDCSDCGSRQEMPLYKRWYDCPVCGLSLDRDYNSALVIKKRGLVIAQQLGFVEIEDTKSMKQEAHSKVFGGGS